MKRRIAIIIACCLLLVGVAVRAAQEQPSPLNERIGQTAAQINLLDAPVIYGEAISSWEVFLPFSENGLGGGSSYKGMLALGIPAEGGAVPPDAVIVGPGPILAVEDRGLTRLYDGKGNDLGVRDGYPVGFLPGGLLVTSGGGVPITAWTADGAVAWQKDPFAEAISRFGGDTTGLELLGGWGTGYTTPGGEVHYDLTVELARLVSVPSPEAPNKTMHMLEPVVTIQARVAYDATGKELSFERGIHPPLAFSGQDRAFSAGIPVGNGFAHREFDIRNSRPVFKRTLHLPSSTIYAVGSDGSLLCLDGPQVDDEPMTFSVYREGAPVATRFALPQGHWFVGADDSGHLYSMRVSGHGVTVSAFRWPSP